MDGLLRRSIWTSGRQQAGVWGLLLLFLSACSSTPGPTPGETSSVGATVEWVGSRRLPLVLYLPNWPASSKQLPTTSASIYLGNLDARIEQLWRNYERQPDPDLAQALATSLTHRYRIRGVLADAEAAGDVLAAQVAAHPEHAALQLAHASWLAIFHRFEQARVAISLARTADLSSSMLASLSDEIDLALGRYAELGPAFERPGENPPADIYQLAARANTAVLRGDLDLASRLYFEAQTHYRDVGPFPLAWLHTQQGIALLRFGEHAQAARFFAAARERLPAYYLASEHLAECLAELGRLDEARALYAEVIEQTGNAEFLAALAALEERAGKTERAHSLRRQAEQAYQSLLERHPEAYAQHAAEFYLEIGRIDQARVLAERNLALRQDVGSRLLAGEVALSGGDLTQSCAQLHLVAATGLRPPEYLDLLQRVDCGDVPSTGSAAGFGSRR